MEILLETIDEKDSFFNFGGSDNFVLNGYRCFAGIDINHISRFETVKKLKVQALADQPIYYAFGSSSGLCITTPNGSIRDKNLLSKLLSLSGKDEDLSNFFEEYGFIFPASNDQYSEYDLNDIKEVLNHLKSTALLMSELQNPDPDYTSILRNTFYLLLSDPVEVLIPANAGKYKTCVHKISSIISKASSIPEYDHKKELFDCGKYKIKDLICPVFNEIDPDLYKDIQSTYAERELPVGWNTTLFKDIVYLYVNDPNESNGIRFIIDYLYHFMVEIGAIKSVSYENGIQLYDDKIDIVLNERLQHNLFTLAKIVLNEELNSNLNGIIARFSVSNMQPSWRAKNLLSALYFSIFYTNPKSDIYRKCANPSCDKYFLVKASNSRKIYCSKECRNAAAQRSHRLKLKHNNSKDN